MGSIHTLILLQGSALHSNAMQISLDPPISSLADATFELLRMQHWFDAILLIDDTAASDLFSYRLTRLCRKNKRKIIRSNYSQFSLFNSSNIIKRSHERKRTRNYNMFDSIWSRLQVIQLSKNLLSKEVSKY